LPIVNEAVKDDTSTSISLVGKNYANYGIVLNENFVHILENFSNATAPSNPLEGQLWWNSGTKNLRVYSGSSWKTFASATSGSTQPPAPTVGDQWFNTNTNQFSVWDGTKWVIIGPSAMPGTGISGAVAEAILDTANPPGTHIVVKLYVENQVVAIVSKDAKFTPATTITGFTDIAPGVTVATTYATAELNNSLVTKQYVNTVAGGQVDPVAMAVALG
jgi:hypothetical protein